MQRLCRHKACWLGLREHSGAWTWTTGAAGGGHLELLQWAHEMGNTDAVAAGFLTTKLNAFVGTVPTAILIYAVLRQCESGQPPSKATGMV